MLLFGFILYFYNFIVKILVLLLVENVNKYFGKSLFFKGVKWSCLMKK